VNEPRCWCYLMTRDGFDVTLDERDGAPYLLVSGDDHAQGTALTDEEMRLLRDALDRAIADAKPTNALAEIAAAIGRLPPDESTDVHVARTKDGIVTVAFS
jgi:hypothetical protein